MCSRLLDSYVAERQAEEERGKEREKEEKARRKEKNGERGNPRARRRTGGLSYVKRQSHAVPGGVRPPASGDAAPEQQHRFSGGAGVSTESGIPDFRSESGIFKAVQEYGYPPETLLSAPFFHQNTQTFYDYYRKYLIYPDASPNRAHRGPRPSGAGG